MQAACRLADDGSQDGALMECGPFRLVPGSKGELVETEGAWNEYANVVFSASRRLRHPDEPS